MSLKKGILQQFVSHQQKRWREQSSHKFEGSESVQSLQTLQDGRFAKVCVAKKGLHAQNRPEGYILQRSSTQRFTKLSTVSLGRKLVRVPVPMLWFGTSSHNIQKTIKDSNLSFETSMITVIIYLDDLLILGNSMSEIFTARGSVIFLLQHLGFVISLKKCVLDPVQERELLGLILNSQTMNLSLPNEKIVKTKDQCLSFYKASDVSLLDLKKLIGKLFSTIQAVLPARLQFRFLQQQQILSLKQTQCYLTLVKVIPMTKNELLWWVNNPELCNGGLVIQPQI